MARKKKTAALMVDEKKGHLFFGDNLRLLMLRPIDLIEFSEFAGANAEDITMWVGKTVGKYFMEKLYPDEEWTGVALSQKKEVLQYVLETLTNLGYGELTLKVNKANIQISVYEPLSEPEKDNIMAKNICTLYNGIFSGVLEGLDVDVDGQEIKCFLLGDEACIFKFDLLIDEFEEDDIDADEQQKSGVSGFLGTL